MEEADLPLIFERFYQAKGRETTGIGIGLSIVKEIIWRHHGQITARNTRDAAVSMAQALIDAGTSGENS